LLPLAVVVAVEILLVQVLFSELVVAEALGGKIIIQ
jgi:hypothetical protein